MVKRYSKHRNIDKESLIGSLSEQQTSTINKYCDFFIGNNKILELIKYELFTCAFGLIPGGTGYLLRKWFYPRLLKKAGRSIHWGRNVSLRCPNRIEIGNNVAIDDNCLLDARGSGDNILHIGNEVLIARDSIIQCKTSWIEIGNDCILGSQCQFSSAGGITLGNYVMIAGQCYIGGGRYHHEDKSIPMMHQGLYSVGPITIHDDVWIGANVSILDGMEIGGGAIVGAGSVITRQVPSMAIVSGVPARVIGWRTD